MDELSHKRKLQQIKVGGFLAMVFLCMTPLFALLLYWHWEQ